MSHPPKENCRFCPRCGGPLAIQDQGGQLIPTCQDPSCGFIFWQNSKPCATAIITNDAGQVLLTKRAIAPDKGKLDLPGGFLHEGEDPKEGLMRELSEELGIVADIGDYVGYAVDTYDRDSIYVLNLCFQVTIRSGAPKAHDEISDIIWVDPKSVDMKSLAFTNNEKLLRLWTKIHP